MLGGNLHELLQGSLYITLGFGLYQHHILEEAGTDIAWTTLQILEQLFGCLHSEHVSFGFTLGAEVKYTAGHISDSECVISLPQRM